jgi:hypothetical protein
MDLTGHEVEKAQNPYREKNLWNFDIQFFQN